MNLFNRKLVSPRVEDYKPQVPFSQKIIDKTVRPVANTAVDYGKLLFTSAGSGLASLGSASARGLGANKLAENLAQKSIDIRKAGGYGIGGQQDARKAVKTTTDALITTYGLGNIANIPKAVTSITSSFRKPVVQAVPQVATQIAKAPSARAIKKQLFQRLNKQLGRTGSNPVTYTEMKSIKNLFKR